MSGGLETQAARDHGRAALITDCDERGIALTRQAREPNGDTTREHRRAVEHHQRERPTAQQHIRAPRRARSITRPDHPHPGPLTEMRPVPRREGARRIDVRHPEPFTDRALHDAAHESGFPTAQRADDFGEPPPRHAFTRQHTIELTNTRGQTRSVRFREVENVGELLPEGEK